jgi:hypothetical protein
LGQLNLCRRLEILPEQRLWALSKGGHKERRKRNQEEKEAWGDHRVVTTE